MLQKMRRQDTDLSVCHELHIYILRVGYLPYKM